MHGIFSAFGIMGNSLPLGLSKRIEYTAAHHHNRASQIYPGKSRGVAEGMGYYPPIRKYFV